MGLLTAQGYYPAALMTTAVVIVSLYLLRLIEDRLLYPHVGRTVGVRVRFRSPGCAPLAGLLGALQQARVTVKEMTAGPCEDETDTIHLLLKLPRGLDEAKLTLIAGLEEVRTIGLD